MKSWRFLFCVLSLVACSPIRASATPAVVTETASPTPSYEALYIPPALVSFSRENPFTPVSVSDLASIDLAHLVPHMVFTADGEAIPTNIKLEGITINEPGNIGRTVLLGIDTSRPFASPMDVGISEGMEWYLTNIYYAAGVKEGQMGFVRPADGEKIRFIRLIAVRDPGALTTDLYLSYRDVASNTWMITSHIIRISAMGQLEYTDPFTRTNIELSGDPEQSIRILDYLDPLVEYNLLASAQQFDSTVVATQLFEGKRYGLDVTGRRVAVWEDASGAWISTIAEGISLLSDDQLMEMGVPGGFGWEADLSYDGIRARARIAFAKDALPLYKGGLILNPATPASGWTYQERLAYILIRGDYYGYLRSQGLSGGEYSFDEYLRERKSGAILYYYLPAYDLTTNAQVQTHITPGDITEFVFTNGILSEECNAVFNYADYIRFGYCRTGYGAFRSVIFNDVPMMIKMWEGVTEESIPWYAIWDMVVIMNTRGLPTSELLGNRYPVTKWKVSDAEQYLLHTPSADGQSIVLEPVFVYANLDSNK